MRKVTLDDLAAYAGDLQAANEIVTVERDGQPVGYYVPLQAANGEVTRELLSRTNGEQAPLPTSAGGQKILPPESPEAKEALRRLQESIAHGLKGTGMTADELADMIDLRNPL